MENCVSAFFGARSSCFLLCYIHASTHSLGDLPACIRWGAVCLTCVFQPRETRRMCLLLWYFEVKPAALKDVMCPAFLLTWENMTGSSGDASPVSSWLSGDVPSAAWWWHPGFSNQKSVGLIKGSRCSDFFLLVRRHPTWRSVLSNALSEGSPSHFPILTK